MTTKYQDKLAELWEEMQLTIINRIREVGKYNSRDYSEKVIKLPSDLQYNFGDGGDYAIEVYEQGYYSNNGQIYSFSCLDYEQVSEIADYCDSIREYYQPDFEGEGIITSWNGTELKDYEVYSSKELAREDFPDRTILRFSGDDIEEVTFIK